ncbi:MAG: glycosyltransferase family 2 protein [Fibrobacterota bacterium]
MHHTVFETIFWVTVGILAYTYAAYPVLVFFFGLLFRRRRTVDPSYRPRVTLIIPAHNEAGCIEKKIKNALDSDYPADRLEILVASDASEDETVKIARRYEGRIRVLDYRERRGKMGTVNRAVTEAQGDILVLTDANAMYAGYTIKELVKHFADSSVGCVSGAKIIRNMDTDTTTGVGESGYWKYEAFLKYAEALSGSCVGADGSVYAVRKEAYPFPPDQRIIMDDLAVSLLIVQKGYACVFEPSARAFEESSKRIRQEFKRKIRIFAGAFSFFLQCPGALLTRLFIKTVSHKILRWLTFAFQAVLFVCSFFLAADPLFRPVFGVQAVFYACAAAGLFLNHYGVRILVFQIPYYFTMTTFAQIYGFWHYLRQGRTPAWEKLR